MNTDFYQKADIEMKLKQISEQIDDVLSQEQIDDKKYTKLMFQQLMQGLYLQNVNM